MGGRGKGGGKGRGKRKKGGGGKKKSGGEEKREREGRKKGRGTKEVEEQRGTGGKNKGREGRSKGGRRRRKGGENKGEGKGEEGGKRRRGREKEKGRGKREEGGKKEEGGQRGRGREKGEGEGQRGRGRGKGEKCRPAHTPSLVHARSAHILTFLFTCFQKCTQRHVTISWLKSGTEKECTLTPAYQHGSGAMPRRDGGFTESWRTAGGAPSREANWRAVWCVFTSGEQEDDETEADKQQAASAREYDDKLESELQKIYDGVLSLVDRSLSPTASTWESTVIHYKTKGGVEVQLIDEVVDMSVVSQRQVPANEQLQKTVVDVPVVLRRQAPMIQKVLKIVEGPQVQYIGKIGDVSVVTKRHVPTVQTAHETEEVPQVQFIDPWAECLS